MLLVHACTTYHLVAANVSHTWWASEKHFAAISDSKISLQSRCKASGLSWIVSSVVVRNFSHAALSEVDSEVWVHCGAVQQPSLEFSLRQWFDSVCSALEPFSSSPTGSGDESRLVNVQAKQTDLGSTLRVDDGSRTAALNLAFCVWQRRAAVSAVFPSLPCVCKWNKRIPFSHSADKSFVVSVFEHWIWIRVFGLSIRRHAVFGFEKERFPPDVSRNEALNRNERFGIFCWTSSAWCWLPQRTVKLAVFSRRKTFLSRHRVGYLVPDFIHARFALSHLRLQEVQPPAHKLSGHGNESSSSWWNSAFRLIVVVCGIRSTQGDTHARFVSSVAYCFDCGSSAPRVVHKVQRGAFLTQTGQLFELTSTLIHHISTNPVLSHEVKSWERRPSERTRGHRPEWTVPHPARLLSPNKARAAQPSVGAVGWILFTLSIPKDTNYPEPSRTRETCHFRRAQGPANGRGKSQNIDSEGFCLSKTFDCSWFSGVCKGLLDRNMCRRNGADAGPENGNPRLPNPWKFPVGKFVWDFVSTDLKRNLTCGLYPQQKFSVCLQF